MNLIFSFVVSFILIIFIVVLVFVSLQNYRIQKRMDEINSNEMKQTLGLKFTKETSASIIEFLNTLDVDEIKSLPDLISKNANHAIGQHKIQNGQIIDLSNELNLLRRNVSYSLNRLTIDFIDTYSDSCNNYVVDKDLRVEEKDVLQQTFVFGLFSDIMNEIFDIEEITRTFKPNICSLVDTLKTVFIKDGLTTTANSVIISLEKNILTNYGTNKNDPYTSLPTIPLYAFLEKNKHKLYTDLKDEEKRVFIFTRYFPRLFSYIFTERWDYIFSKINTMMKKFFEDDEVNNMYNATTTPFVFFNQFFLDYSQSMGDERDELIESIFKHINTEVTSPIQMDDESVLSKILYLYIPEMLIMSYYNMHTETNSSQPYHNFIDTFLFTRITSEDEIEDSEMYILKRIFELFSTRIKDESMTMNFRYDFLKTYLDDPLNINTLTKATQLKDFIGNLYGDNSVDTLFLNN